MNTAQSKAVEGRKNFAISYCQDQIFVTGGMDNGQNIISDLLMFDILTLDWTELKQMRKKYSDVESSHYFGVGTHSQDSSPTRNDTLNYDSAGEPVPRKEQNFATETCELSKETKFTVDTQSTFEKKKRIPNPVMQQEALKPKK